MKSSVRQTICPLLAAFFWGTAIAAQKICTAYLAPFALNCIRSALAFVILLVICLCRRKKKYGTARDITLGSLCCGTALFLASNLQYIGLSGTSSGKVGFITALYIILVPLIGRFFGKKTSPQIWAAVALAVVGMYFLCVKEDFSLSISDLQVLIGAFLFAAQILLVDHFVQSVDSIALSCGQFLVVTVLSALCMGITAEKFSAVMLAKWIWPLLYVAIFSNVVAYTLQIVAQKGANPTIVSLLLSMESVFSALSGALLLHERLGRREAAGCGLMMAAVILAQLPGLLDRKRRKAKA